MGFGLLTLCFFNGCGSQGQPAAPGVEVRSALERDTQPDIDSQSLQSQVLGNTGFVLDLYKRLAIDPGDNLFFSPYSISVALAMTYAGANNETAQQMRDTLGFILDDADLHPAFNALGLSLIERAQQDGVEISVANQLFGQRDFMFAKDFLDILAAEYGAGMKLMDFRTAYEEARLAINDWVSDVTHARIQDLLPKGSLSSLTRLVLVNAIYFLCDWQVQFDPAETVSADFRLLSGGTVEVDMMNVQDNFSYYQEAGLEAVELLYAGEELSMLIIVPAQGTLEDFEQELIAEQVQTIVDGLHETEVNLSIPKFEATGSTISLKEYLVEMGMPAPFGEQGFVADFSGMIAPEQETPGLFISDVYHKAFIAVSEEGTEAAAATAVVMDEYTSVEPAITYMRVDRPFIYLIRDKTTNNILFIGRMLDPS
jgi:serpin B